MQGATNWRRQPQAVGMTAVGLSLKSYPAVISHCTRQAVSKPVACSCHHLSQQAFEDVPPPTPCEGSQNRTKCGVPMKSFECLIRVWVCTFSPWQRRWWGGVREESKLALPPRCKWGTQVAGTAACVYFGSQWQNSLHVVEMVVMASGGRREGKAGLRISGGFVTWPLPCNVSHLFPSIFREHSWDPESSRCCWTYVLNEWWDNVAAVEAISIGCGFLFPHHVFITWQVGWFVSPLECELGQIFATSFFPTPRPDLSKEDSLSRERWLPRPLYLPRPPKHLNKKCFLLGWFLCRCKYHTWRTGTWLLESNSV